MKREEKSREKIEKHPFTTLTSFVSHESVSKRSSTFPLPRIDTVYRVPKMPCRESVGAWKNIGPSPWTRVSAYTSEIYFLIRGCALGRRRWVDGFNRKTGCHSYPSEFYECLEPSYESQSPASSCLLPLHPPIPALENRFRKHRLVPDLADLFLQLGKIPVNGKHARARLESMQAGCYLWAIYKFRRLAEGQQDGRGFYCEINWNLNGGISKDGWQILESSLKILFHFVN